jgi:hypothetical protein
MRAGDIRFRDILFMLTVAAVGLGLARKDLRQRLPWVVTRAIDYAPRRASPARSAPAHIAAPDVSPPTDDAAPAVHSDSEFAQDTAGYGLVLAGPSDSVASYYFVTLLDSSTSLPALGFVRASSLLAKTTELEPFADGARLPRVRAPSPSVVDSALRARDDGCVLEVPVPVRPALPSNGSWILALAPGAAEVLPSSAWRTPSDSQQTTDALSLAASVPMSTSDVATGVPRPSKLFAGIPLQLVAQNRFTVDGAEIMIVETRREVKRRAGAAQGGDSITIAEQRLLIAERDPSRKGSPFKVVWHHYSADDPDQLVTETPLAMLRLGRARVLTLFTDGRYRDGGGGLFIARVGHGAWRTVASWYTGC